jgi:hypothetical protein
MAFQADLSLRVLATISSDKHSNYSGEWQCQNSSNGFPHGIARRHKIDHRNEKYRTDLTRYLSRCSHAGA